MDDRQKEKFGSAIAVLVATSGQELTKTMLHGYWIALQDLDLASVEHAVARAIRTVKNRYVSPAEIRELAIGGSADDRALSAWCDVQRGASVSYMADLDFQDRVINAVIRSLGGRNSFFDRYSAGTESEKWLRIEFEKAYKLISSRSDIGEEQIAILPGNGDTDVVKGRFYKPRLEVIPCDHSRAIISPVRISGDVNRRQGSQVKRIGLSKMAVTGI